MERDARTFHSAPDDPARAVVDASGRLVELSLEPRLLRGSPQTVARVIVKAVTEAQDAAAASRVQPLAEGAALPPESAAAAQRQLADALAEVEIEAGRRLSELRVLVSDLIRGTQGRS